jgi:hypothetical protein
MRQRAGGWQSSWQVSGKALGAAILGSGRLGMQLKIEADVIWAPIFKNHEKVVTIPPEFSEYCPRNRLLRCLTFGFGHDDHPS